MKTPRSDDSWNLPDQGENDMTAYIRFLRNGTPIPGGVRTGAHAGWSELLGFSMGGRTSASLNRTVQIKTFACPSDPVTPLQPSGVSMGKVSWSDGGVMFQPGGAAGRPDDIAAEVDFTAAGGTAAGLRVRIHGIRIVRSQRTANGPGFESFTFNYSRITFASAPASAPDISQLVRARQVHPSFSPFEPTFSGGVFVG
jgi:hypothetical protein